MPKKETPIAVLKKPFINRIIGSAVVLVEQLLANPFNWRIHPMAQQEALAGMIDEIGFISSVKVNKNTGHVVDGHLRVALALRSGVKEIPVEYLDLTEEEELKALATLDPIGTLATSDSTILEGILNDLKTDDERVKTLLSEIWEKEGIFTELPDLEDLKSTYGEPGEDDFYPVIKIKVTPEIKTRFDRIMGVTPGGNETEKFTNLVETWEEWENAK